MESLNVLVIEDITRNQEAARRQLEARGHKVTVAKDLLEAEALLEGIDPKRLLASQYSPSIEAAFDVVLTNEESPAGLAGVLPGALERALERVLEEGVTYLAFALALKAVASGIKFVAMVADETYDDGETKRPALDSIGMNKVFNVNGARVIFAHAPKTGFDVHKRGVTDWGRVLDDLVAD